MSLLASAILVATLSTAGAPPQDASLRFVSKQPVLVGISFGLNAVDGRALVLGQRTATQVAAGRRTIWYSCPNGPLMSEGSSLSFDFVPGKNYELSCGSGGAQIRVAEGC